MKFDLVVKDASAADVSRILALFGSTAIGAATATSGPAIAGNGASAGDDDTTGDVAAQPGQLDGKGIPWDDRIHSTPATLTTKGVWRAKRGVTPQLVAQVEAELKARAAQQSQPGGYQQPTPMFDAGTQQPVQQYQQQPGPAMQQPAYQPQPMQQPMQQPVQQYQPQPMQQPGPAMQQQPYQPQPGYQPVAEQPAYQPQPTPQPGDNDPMLMAWGMQGDPVDFNGFMAAMQQQFNNRDGNGQPFIEANYLASITPTIAAKFGVNLPAITSIGTLPGGGAEVAQYAVRLMRSHGRWK